MLSPKSSALAKATVSVGNKSFSLSKICLRNVAAKLDVGNWTVFSTVTSLCTECCKKILDEAKISYASNVVVFIIACVVGVCGTGVYYLLNSIEFNTINIVYMILMGVATSISAMVGYDKVIQTIEQLRK